MYEMQVNFVFGGYVDNCLIHPLISMYDTQVSMTPHCDLADSVSGQTKPY